MVTRAVLLINLGTPDSAAPEDVKKYLIEFLTDPRVIDLPFLSRQFLVRGVIVPKRYQESAASYKKIWTEEGSPLLVYGRRVQEKLQKVLGEDYLVELAMRYQSPSIESRVAYLLEQRVEELVILPLFPQYASATTGSVYQKVMEVLASCQLLPQLHFIDQFAAYPPFIKAFAAKVAGCDLDLYDHILFSFHGLPEKQLIKADRGNWCLQVEGCCEKMCKENRSCYGAQCYRTMEALAKELCLEKGQYSLCYQSRLGKDPWLQPYASEVIMQLAQKGMKKVLVFCPSFVCDCLETLFEYGVEYQKEFVAAGGEKLELVSGLNDDDLWVEALRQLVLQQEKPLLVEPLCF